MADPITIVGTAAAVANIIAIAKKTIELLCDLHTRWNDADFTVLNLIAQVTALKTASCKIQEWIESDLAEQHHQLVMDLELSMTCCQMLMAKMDSQISELCRTADNALNAGSKIKVLFACKKNEELQKLIERQTNALTLLLTACNCKTLSEQKALLEKPSSRKIMKRVRDDSSSLCNHTDTASLYSRCADSLSRVSIIFDREHPVSLTESIRRRQADVRLTRSQLKKQAVRSRAIDLELNGDGRKLRRECKVLVCGKPESGKEALVRQMMIIHKNDYSIEERALHRDRVRRILLKAMRAVIEHLRETGIELNNQDMKMTEIILHEIGKSEANMAQITPLAANAMKSLWDSTQFRSFFHRAVVSNSIGIPDSAEYLFRETQRIAQPDYIPTSSDIIRIQDRSAGIQEHTFTIDQLTIHMIDCGGNLSTGKKWVHQFEGVTSVLFVVDLSSYDQVLPGDSFKNRVVEALELFESVINCRWFLRSSIILLLNNFERFKQKLVTRPLRDYFCDYSGGNDINRTAKYILSRFNQVNRAHQNLFSHLTEVTDMSYARFVLAAIKQTMLQQALSNIGRL